LVRLNLGLLSLGAFLIIIALWVAAWILQAVIIENLVPLILLSSGVWTVVVAGLKAVRHEGNGTGAFSTFGWGMLFIVLGGSLYLINAGMDPLYTVVFILILVGALAVATALRSARR
jgi:hypothetical protein